LPAAKTNGIDTVLSNNLFVPFILVTVLLAGTANIINDIMDRNTDVINNKNNYVAKGEISSLAARNYYRVLIIIGLGISYWIAIEINRKGLVLIYPVAAILLYAYSYRLKSTPLIGNVIVSLFCALVPGILWYAESSTLVKFSDVGLPEYGKVFYLLSGFTVFSFMANFVREQVKDMEDLEGDKATGVHSFPVVFGVGRAIMIAMFSLIMTIAVSCFWLYEGYPAFLSTIELLISFLCICLMPFALLIKLSKSKKTSHYASLSKWIKIYMGLGLILLIILS
jgi:4-hydroxybenzoate polyprenyltransferase